jgi:MFS family permease
MIGYARSLRPELPRNVWVVQGGGLVNAFGNGVVLPFLIIYLHNVRGVALGIAGLVAAANSAAALVTGFVAGALSDRIGPRNVLVGALLVMTGAILLFPLIRTSWNALALGAALGAGSGAFWPSQSSLLAAFTPPPRRHSAFALQRVTMNLGLALGGLTGGLIASSADPSSYTTLFLLDAATFLGYVLVLLRLPAPRLSEHRADATGSYREVLRDRPFRSYVLLNALFIGAGIAVIAELLPPYAKNDASVSETGVGALWFVNALVVVVAQLPVAKLAEGRRRMLGLALMGAIWAATMLVIAAAGTWLEATAATALLAVAVAAFGIGECLHGTIHVPLTADLAPPRLAGRYLALSSQSWQVGWIVGPAIGGFLLQHAPLALWLGAAGATLAGAARALTLERGLPPPVRRTPTAVEAAQPVLEPEAVPAG